MVAVSGDPLRTNAYAFAHNGILGYPDDEADPPPRGAGRDLLREARGRASGSRADAWTRSGCCCPRASAPRASGSTTRCGRARRRRACSRARRCAGEFPRQRVELIRDADPTAEVNRLYRLRGWTDGLPIVPPTLGRVDEMLARGPLERHVVLGEMEPLGGVATRGEGRGQRGDGGLPAGVLPGGAGRGAGHPRSRVQPARRADHRRERGAAAHRQRAGGAAARHQRGLGRARPGLAGQRDDRPRGAPRHEQPGRRVAGRGLLRRPRPAGRYTLCLAEREDTPWPPLHVELGYRRSRAR